MESLLPPIFAGLLLATFYYLYKRFIGRTPSEKIVDSKFDKVISYIDSEEKVIELNNQIKENGYYDYLYFNPEKNIDINSLKDDLAILQFFRGGDFSIDDELNKIDSKQLIPFVKKHDPKIKNIQDGCLVLQKLVDIDDNSFGLLTLSNGYQAHEMVFFYHLIEITDNYYKIWSANIEGYQSNNEKEKVYQLAYSLREGLTENSFISDLISEKRKYWINEQKQKALIQHFKKKMD